MGEDPVWRLDATGQAALVRSGEVGAVELVEAALARAQNVANLHAVTVLFPDRARRRAAQATGPFAGVPILLKDAGQEVAGTPLWMGTAALKNAGHISTETTDLAARLEDLGFVIIGKAAVPELMTGITTEPPIGPPTANPWAHDRTVGGSSGGSAAAVAAGIVAVAHGSDSTGSLRYPASCCGVLTLKPTAARIPSRMPGGIANPGDIHTDFVLTRTARDLRQIFAEVATPSAAIAPIRRVGVLKAMPFGMAVDRSVHQALLDVADELARAGCTIEAAGPEFLEDYGIAIGQHVATLVASHRAAVIDWIENRLGRPVTTADLSPVLVEEAERGRSLTLAAVDEARAEIQNAARTAARAWRARTDGLLLPILDRGPWPNGTPGSDGRLAGLVCSVANFAGQPAVVIPTVQKGLPVGVQLLGGAGNDEALLDLLQLIRPAVPASPYLASTTG